jgi:hypothetical protein
MGEPIKIAIVLEGGCLSAVLTAGVPVEFVLVDYDTEGADAGEIRAIPQDDGSTADALAYTGTAETAGPFVMKAFEAAAPLSAFRVTIRAEGIQVTATGEEQAERYAMDDAREFLAANRYTVESVEPADDDPDDVHNVPADVRVEITAAGPARGEGLWTFAALVTVTVASRSEAEAPDSAAFALELEGELIPAKVYPYAPDACPSKHWNDGTDICADCGTNLQE